MQKVSMSNDTKTRTLQLHMELNWFHYVWNLRVTSEQYQVKDKIKQCNIKKWIQASIKHQLKQNTLYGKENNPKSRKNLGEFSSLQMIKTVMYLNNRDIYRILKHILPIGASKKAKSTVDQSNQHCTFPGIYRWGWYFVLGFTI